MPVPRLRVAPALGMLLHRHPQLGLLLIFFGNGFSRCQPRMKGGKNRGKKNPKPNSVCSRAENCHRVLSHEIRQGPE